MVGAFERKSVESTDFAVMMKLLDQVYDAVATNRLERVSDMDHRVLVGWLEDIQHTTTEILQELDPR